MKNEEEVIKHPLILSFFIIFVLYGIYITGIAIIPSTNNFKLPYDETDVFEMNGTVWTNLEKFEKSDNSQHTNHSEKFSVPGHFASDQVMNKYIRLRAFRNGFNQNITIPSYYVNLIKRNVSVYFTFSVTPLTSFFNKTQNFTSNLLTSISHANHFQKSKDDTLKSETMYVPFFEISVMRQIVDPTKVSRVIPLEYDKTKKLQMPYFFHNEFWVLEDYLEKVTNLTN
ncbi:hypothetical protein EIN_194480, partial [Entamoeba invadens IP1]